MTSRNFFALLAGLAAASCSASGVATADALAEYVPEADCKDARFELIESEGSIQDWFYVVSIDGSAACAISLQRALEARGAVRSEIPFVNGLLLPGHTNTEKEAVAFDFDHEGHKVIWTRDKR